MTKDKKQLLVVGVLLIVVLAVGAFQFMGLKSKPAETTNKEKPKDGELVADANEAKDPMDLYIETLIASSSTPRDPFIPQAVLIDEPEDPSTSVTPDNKGQGKTMPGPEIGGAFPRDPGNLTGGNGGGGTEIVPEGGNVLNGQTFSLRGVMIGRTRKLCMIEFSDGRQTLVVEGQSFGNNMETTVVRITEQYVVLRHQGAERTLGLNGGN